MLSKFKVKVADKKNSAHLRKLNYSVHERKNKENL